MGGSFVDDVKARGVKVFHHPLGGRRLPIALMRILDLIRQERPDVLDAWDPQFDVLFGVAAKLTGKPFIGGERSSALQYKIEGGHDRAWFKHLRGPVLKSSASMVVANSEAGASYIRELTEGRAKTKVIRNGIDWVEMDRQIAYLEESGPPPGLPKGDYLLVANRLNPPKRTQIAIATLRELLVNRPNLHLVVLGQGPDEAMLRSHVVQQELSERVHFLGQVPNIAPYLVRAKVFFSASAVEGMPNSVVEAMGLGIPVVASQIEAHEELLKASKGGLVLFNAEDEAEPIQRVSRILSDATFRDNLTFLARTYARSCTVEKMAGEYEALYREYRR